MRAAQWWDAHRGYFPESVELEPPVDPAEKVVDLVRRLWNDQGKARMQRQQDCTELYYGCDWSGDDEGVTRDALRGVGIEAEPSGYNVVQSVTDTSVSRLVLNRVRPLILTENGNAEQQQQAEALQKVVEGTFWDAKIYGELGEHVCYDGHLFDAGGVKVYPDYAGKRLILDRIDPCRFMVSPRESRLGAPRSGYYYDAIDRSELLAMFRDADDDVIQAIMEAKNAPRDLSHSQDTEEFVDDVEICEAWHLPSSRVDRSDPKAWGIGEDGEYDPRLDPGHDGRRVLCIEGKTLIDEPWPFPYFPIAWFKPMRKRRSYWSRSVPEVLAGAQLMINTMNSRVDRIMHFHGRPILYVWRNAKINVAKITNDVASILEGNVPPGQAIQHITPQSVPGEYLSRIDKIAMNAERQWGMNEMAMTGQKPAGIEHAPALEHLADELSARHTTKSRAWEGFHQDLAQLVIDGHRMLADYCKQKDEDYSVVFGDDKQLEQIDWSKADLGAAVYRVKVWPTNLLPLTPAARANTLIEWMQAGLVTAQEALAMTGHPDTDRMIRSFLAKKNNIEKKIAKLISGAKFEDCMPHPYMDIDMCLAISSERLNELEANEADDETLDRLRQFYEVAAQLKQDALAREQALKTNTNAGLAASQGGPPTAPSPGGPPAPPPGPPPPGAGPLPPAPPAAA